MEKIDRLFGRSVNSVALSACIAVAVPVVAFAFMAMVQPLPKCPNNLIPAAWDKCQGLSTLGNGTKYFGEFRQGELNGVGTFVFTNRDTYVGEVKVGLPTGKGTYTFANGDTYVGTFTDLKLNGLGTSTFADGSKYVGEFKDDLRDGHGSYTYRNGNVYVGDFKNNMRNGRGTLTYAASGEKYVGEFVDDKRDGEGTLRARDGSVLADGIWDKGKFWAPRPDDVGEIKMKSVSGGYSVPVRFNHAITLEAIVDSGAADLVVPAYVLKTLISTKTVTQNDMMEQATVVIADGSEMATQRFRIRSLQVGNRVLENVIATTAPDTASILLGQSVLKKFSSWSIDNQRQMLVLK
jgi:hypothetical protein